MPDDEPLRIPSNETTQALIARHQAGDLRALERVIERNYARIRSIVRVRAGPALLQRVTVDDILHDVLGRVIDGIEGYVPRSDASWIDWVARLAQNEIANQARHAAALKRGGPTARLVQQHADSASAWDVPDETTGVASKAARQEEVAIFEQCCGELSEPHREVILLRFAGMDWKSVAEQMGRPSPEACQELFRRARLELCRRISQRV